jgi:hypothetical protein
MHLSIGPLGAALRCSRIPQGVCMRSRSRLGALILIVLGLLFLLSNFGWIPRLGPLFAQWWPLILIVVGASLLIRQR